VHASQWLDTVWLTRRTYERLFCFLKHKDVAKRLYFSIWQKLNNGAQKSGQNYSVASRIRKSGRCVKNLRMLEFFAVLSNL